MLEMNRKTPRGEGEGSLGFAQARENGWGRSVSAVYNLAATQWFRAGAKAEGQGVAMTFYGITHRYGSES